MPTATKARTGPPDWPFPCAACGAEPADAFRRLPSIVAQELRLSFGNDHAYQGPVVDLTEPRFGGYRRLSFTAQATDGEAHISLHGGAKGTAVESWSVLGHFAVRAHSRGFADEAFGEHGIELELPRTGVTAVAFRAVNTHNIRPRITATIRTNITLDKLTEDNA